MSLQEDEDSQDDTEAEEFEDCFINEDIVFASDSITDATQAAADQEILRKLEALADQEAVTAANENNKIKPKLSLSNAKFEGNNQASLSSDAESSDSTDGEDWQPRPDSPDYPPEYWQVQRLIKYIKVSFTLCPYYRSHSPCLLICKCGKRCPPDVPNSPAGRQSNSYHNLPLIT